MDQLRDFEEDRGSDLASSEHQDGVEAARLEIGSDERRMHVRAYNHWVSLLHGRAYPSIEDLDPAGIADFGQHSVLLDFSRGIDNPAISFLGRALREECALDSSVTHIAQVPSRSLLSRLTDHYLQIIANRAPIGFEAEFVSSRGYNTLYRGILMPFSSDDDSIDFIYGVINWKELVDVATQAALHAEIAAAVRKEPAGTVVTPVVWADGPNGVLGHDDGDADDLLAEDDDDDDRSGADAADPRRVAADRDAAGNDRAERHGAHSLADRLTLAQQTAAAVRAADTRSRATLYRALARAHDFAAAADADPVGYEALLDAAGITLQLRAPMTPIAKLVFGADYDKTRLTEFAAVLAYARRTGVATGGLAGFLDGHAGGIKAVVAAERAARRPSAPRRTRPFDAQTAPVLARVAVPGNLVETAAPGDPIVLLARVGADHLVEIVAVLDQPGLTARAAALAGR